MIPYSKQEIDDSDIEAVINVLKSPLITQGNVSKQFEEMLATRVNAQHCSVLSNATAALHVSCLALGVGKGDTVWTVPNSFVASANCAIYAGANIDFVDIDADTRNICIRALEAKLASASGKERYQKSLYPYIFLACRVRWNRSLN